MTNQAVAKRDTTAIAIGEGGIQLATIAEAYEFASVVLKSGLAPKGFSSPEAIMIAVQSGMELGFSPMRALSAVVVVNGRPSLYGEAILALVHDRGICSRPPVLGVRGTGDDRVGFCRFQRNNMPEAIETTFSVADAKRAKLWGKAGPWTDYSDDMLQWRALSRANKRYFSDVTLGLVSVEEARDYPAEAAPRSLNPPAEPDPLLSGAIDAELIDEAEPLAPATKQAEKPLQTLAERAEAAAAFLRAAKSGESLEKRWKNTKSLCDELRDPIAQVDPHLYANLKNTYEECAATFAPKSDNAADTEALVALSKRAKKFYVDKWQGDETEAAQELGELTDGACKGFALLATYLADNPAFVSKLVNSIGGGE